ncbi:MAG: DUF962 domain-containing protein [Schleiferiaceae bacterium]
MEKKYKSLREFYPFYLSEHVNPISRALHFIGTTLVVMCFAFFLITLDWVYFAIIPLLGYGFAWVGHFFFEKNKPATFQYPLWSLASDFMLWWDIIRGKEKIAGR